MLHIHEIFPNSSMSVGEKQPAWSSDDDVRQIKQLFPNSHFVKIPGAGHWVHLEKSDDFLSAVVSFLQTEF